MTPSKSRFAIAVWAAGNDEPYAEPSFVLRIEADNPGATALQNAIASIGPNSDATQIKQAITQGFNQLDVASVVPEPEMPASEAPTVDGKPPVDIILRAAEAAHEANRAYCADVLMDNSQLPWAEAPEWQKQSAIDGVNFAIANHFPSPEAMHENWLKDKLAAGWKYGEVKDPEAKTHPCIRPYDELPETQQAKDKIFRETIMESLGVVG